MQRFQPIFAIFLVNCTRRVVITLLATTVVMATLFLYCLWTCDFMGTDINKLSGYVHFKGNCTDQLFDNNSCHGNTFYVSWA